MSKFSLEKYKKAPSKILIPAWAKSKPLQEKLYTVANEIISEIEAKFINPKQASALKPTQRRVVLAQIAKRLGIDRTNIRRDRMPELIKYIGQENSRLDRAWNNISTKANQGRNLSKPELEARKSDLESALRELENRQLHDYFDRAIQSKVLESQQELAAKYRNMENLYKEAIKLAAKRDEQVKTYVRELSDAIDIIQQLKSKNDKIE